MTQSAQSKSSFNMVKSCNFATICKDVTALIYIYINLWITDYICEDYIYIYIYIYR